MSYIYSDRPEAKTALCILEAVKALLWSMPITHVSTLVLHLAPRNDTDSSTLQVVDEESAIIDGSYMIGFEIDYRSIQRFPSQKDKDYEKILY